MNETLRKYMQAASSYLAALSMPKKIALAGMGSLILVVGVVGLLLLKRDPYQVLYSDLMGEDSRAVTRKLGELGIPYQITDDQKVISVPSSQVYAARMQLAKEGIPGQEVVGFEKFDSSTLGMSSYVQRIQYVRAMQGELTRSIQNLASVKRARVHISMPPKKTFMEDEDPPKASVVLELKSGQAPTKNEINGIAHLVASAVEGLKVSQVTIVDTKGNFLHEPNESSSEGLSSTLLAMQRGIETDYEKRITELLTPVVGLGKVRAKVTADIDPSRTNTMEENYDPEKTVVKNTMKNDEVSQGQRPNPIGIPGSRSNLPGTETQNPPIPMASTSTEKNQQQSNYMVSKKVQTTDKPSGNIKRLTVAVVVDGYYNKGVKGEAETFSPRSEEELRRLQEIVGNAVGFDVQRRDSITVSSLPFKTSDVFSGDDTVPEQKFSWQTFSRIAMRNGLVGLVILLFFFLILRPFLRWATLSDINKDITLLPKTLAELEAARRDEGVLALNKAASMLEEGEPIEKKEEAELRNRIVERLDTYPKKGSRILQEWLDEESLLSHKNLSDAVKA